jgi:hypothetical protein
MQALADLRQGIVALAGKTIRRSLDSTDGKGPIHVGNAWASANELGLVQFTVDAKTNEITALPALHRVIRTHWEIENRVHWVLDVALGEEVNRTQKGESAQNLALMRRLALNLVHHEHAVPVGIAAKQKRAG